MVVAVVRGAVAVTRPKVACWVTGSMVRYAAVAVQGAGRRDGGAKSTRGRLGSGLRCQKRLRRGEEEERDFIKLMFSVHYTMGQNQVILRHQSFTFP